MPSTDYETMILKQYDPLLRAVARRFMARAWRYDRGRSEFEDLYQAIRLGLVEDMRRKGFDPTRIGFARQMLRRAYECSRDNAIVYVPIDRYCHEIDRFAAVPFDQLERDAACHSFEGELARSIDFENWINSLAPEDQSIARRLADGMTLRDLARGQPVKAQRRLSSARHRIRRQYLGLIRREEQQA